MNALSHQGGQPAYSLASDLLKGAKAIAAFCGLTTRQVYWLAEGNDLPVFRMGAALCARKSKLIEWVERQEAGC